MEIRNNNMYSIPKIDNTNFKAMRMYGRSLNDLEKTQDRFMQALIDECSTVELMRVLQVFKKEAKNKVNTWFRDLGYFAGLSNVNGYLKGVVNNKEYWMSDSIFGMPSIPDFLEKLSKKAGKGLNTTAVADRKALDLEHKAERIRFKEALKSGRIDDQEARDKLLDQIFEFVKRNPKIVP